MRTGPNIGSLTHHFTLFPVPCQLDMEKFDNHAESVCFECFLTYIIFHCLFDRIVWWHLSSFFSGTYALLSEMFSLCCHPPTVTSTVSFQKSPHTRIRPQCLFRTDRPWQIRRVPRVQSPGTNSCELLLDRDFNYQSVVVGNFWCWSIGNQPDYLPPLRGYAPPLTLARRAAPAALPTSPARRQSNSGHWTSLWPPPGPRGFTRQPENSKRAHLRVPALQTPPNFHEKTPREREKERKWGREREKKARNFGPPAFGPPPFEPPTLRSRPFGPPPFGPQPLGP